MTKDFAKQIAKCIENVENAEQRKSLQRYVRYCEDNGKTTLNGKQQSTRTIYSKVMAIIPLALLYNKGFKEFTRDDIEDYIDSDEFRLSRKVGKDGKRKVVAQSSLQLYKINIRSFFKWVHFNRDKHMMRKGVYPECVDWMEIKNISKITTPDQLFTDEEVHDMINNSDLLRDQLFIALLYDTGGRLGEILDLTEEKVKPDSYGFTITVDGKTGPRPIRLFMSVPYLKQYLGTPVRGRHLIRTQHGRMSDSNAEMIVKNAAKRVGIERNVYPHLFRHTTATRLASKLTEPQLKAYAGWSANSRMTGHYVHLSGAAIDETMLAIYGIKKEEDEKPSVLEPLTCPRCQEVNAATNALCERCGMNLKVNIPFESESDLMKKEMKIRDIKLEMMQRQMLEMKQCMEYEMGRQQSELEQPPVQVPDEVNERIQAVLNGQTVKQDSDNLAIQIDTLLMLPQSHERDVLIRDLQSQIAEA